MGAGAKKGGMIANFLIVDDDRSFARSAARQYRSFGVARSVSSLAEAAYALHEESWTGMVIDVGLPDGSGLEFLAEVRRARASADFMRSVLVCSGLPNENALRAQSRRLAASYIPKRSAPERHWRFARRAIAAEHVREEAAKLIAGVAQRFELSAMQTRVLALQVAAIPRDEWPGLLGVKQNTIKTHVGRVCGRAEVSSLSELAAPIIGAIMRANGSLNEEPEMWD